MSGAPRHIQSEIENEGPPQLKIDGGEVSSAQARRTSTAGRKPELSTSQRLIMDRINDQGHIRTVEAGVIVHECRPGARKCSGYGAGADRYKGGGKACCGYAGADGLSAMKRLEKRGLVRHVDHGQWK